MLGPHCGDDSIDEAEEDCDDGNVVDDGNGCDASCNQNNMCGNGEHEELFEACDDGNTAGGDYCSADCQDVTGFCGDSTPQTNEDCDDGTNDGSYGTCNGDCTWAARCGDDNHDVGDETCDDGNTVDGDYCSADCQTVTGSCGDSVIQTNEGCDDGGTGAGDGCTATCEEQTGWKCRGEPSYCAFVWYVNDDATGANNGTSWTDAFSDLQDGLAAAGDSEEIWVAAGTYVPGFARADTFQLVTGVALYGGFAGTEDSWDLRNWVTHQTILSGDINGDDGAGFTGYEENIYHVVTSNGTAAAAVLDGFVISGGNADQSSNNDRGGGLFNDGGGPTVRNCRFEANSVGGKGNGIGGAIYDNAGSMQIIACQFVGNRAFSGALHGGAAIYSSSGSPVIVSSLFDGNSAEPGGGALDLWLGTPTIINSIFINNTATGAGGAIRNVGNVPTIINCTFANNSAPANGSAMVNTTWFGADSLPVVTNSIFWGNTSSGGADVITDTGTSVTTLNYSCLEGGWGGAGVFNTSGDPLLTNPAGGNVRLQSMSSSAYNAGSNAALPTDIGDVDGDGDVDEILPLDFYGGVRIQFNTVDMGAAEY